MASGLLVQQAWPNVRLESDRTNIEAMSEKIKSLEDDRMRLRGELEQLSTEKHTLEATLAALEQERTEGAFRAPYCTKRCGRLTVPALPKAWQDSSLCNGRQP